MSNILAGIGPHSSKHPCIYCQGTIGLWEEDAGSRTPHNIEEEWMRANRRQSLAELCNPKLVRLAQVPHRTADREDPKLARRKWQPPHNMGEPQTETH